MKIRKIVTLWTLDFGLWTCHWTFGDLLWTLCYQLSHRAVYVALRLANGLLCVFFPSCAKRARLAAEIDSNGSKSIFRRRTCPRIGHPSRNAGNCGMNFSLLIESLPRSNAGYDRGGMLRASGFGLQGFFLVISPCFFMYTS